MRVYKNDTLLILTRNYFKSKPYVPPQLTNSLELIDEVSANQALLLGRLVRDQGYDLDKKSAENFFTSFTSCLVTSSFVIGSASTGAEIINYDEDLNNIYAYNWTESDGFYILNNSNVVTSSFGLRTKWERVYGFNNFVSDHELMMNGNLILPSSFVFRLSDIRDPPTFPVNNGNIIPFELFPTSFSGHQGITFQNIIYPINHYGVSAFTAVLESIFGDAVDNIYTKDGASTIHTSPTNDPGGDLVWQINMWRDIISFNKDSMMESEPLRWAADKDIGGKYVITSGIMVLKDLIALPTDKAYVAHTSKHNYTGFDLMNTDKTFEKYITQYIPLPSTTIATTIESAGDVIGNVLLKNAIPNFQLDFYSIDDSIFAINTDDVLDGTKRRMYQKWTVEYRGVKKAFGLDIVYPQNRMVLFLPPGYSIRLFSFHFNPLTFGQSSALQNYLMTHLGDGAIFDTHPYWTDIVAAADNQLKIINVVNGGIAIKLYALVGKTQPTKKDTLQMFSYKGRADNDTAPASLSDWFSIDVGQQGGIGYDYEFDETLYNVRFGEVNTNKAIINKYYPSYEETVALNTSITLEKAWYRQTYPKLELNTFNYSKTLRVLAPPPSYIWTLSDVSFTVENRLQYISQKVATQETRMKRLNKILIESIANTDEGLSILADKVTIVNDTLEWLADDIALSFHIINERLDSIEEWIQAQMPAQQTEAGEQEDIFRTVMGIAVGAVSTVLLGNPSVGVNLFNSLMDLTFFIEKTSRASMRGEEVDTMATIMTTLQLAYALGKNSYAMYQGIQSRPKTDFDALGNNFIANIKQKKDDILNASYSNQDIKTAVLANASKAYGVVTKAGPVLKTLTDANEQGSRGTLKLFGSAINSTQVDDSVSLSASKKLSLILLNQMQK